MSDLKAPVWREPLTQRETEILRFISEGLSNREIAEKLFLSVDTVKWYNKQLFAKLGVSSRTQAAALAGQTAPIDPLAASIPGDTARPQHNLPLQLTSFLGRQQEFDQITHLLSPATEKASHAPRERERLVTLVGPGGVGKTRLAVQTGFAFVGKYPDGIWLVDFAPLSDPFLAPQTVAAALGISESKAPLTLANLVNFLQPKCALLLFDNCEHLVDACAYLSLAILQACPRVAILATSREPLGIPGEVSFLLDSLPLPETNAALEPVVLADYAAISLFIERARTVVPDFTLTSANASAVVNVCSRLDGLPLAIELAAARVKMLTVTEIAARLEEGIHILRRAARAGLPRAQTLQDCIEWSYSLLTAGERILLDRLAVFVGGWTLQAVDEVCVGGQIKTTEYGFNLLAQLVEKSLVVVDRRQSNGMRYRFLNTIHRFALEKLQNTPEITTVRDKHLAYFLKIAEERNPILSENNRVEWMRRIEVEYDNFRAALDWSLADRVDSSLCFRLAWQMGEFWRWRGFMEEGRSYFAKILARPGLTGLTRERADLLFMDAWLAFHQGDEQGARSQFEASQAIYEELGPQGRRGESDALNSLAATEYRFGDASAAVAHARKALEIVEQIDHPEGVFFSNYMLGIALGRTGDYEPAWRSLEIALSQARKIGRHSADLCHDIGELAVRQGDNLKGIEYLEKSLTLAEGSMDKWVMGMALGTLGWAHINRAEYHQARQHLERSLAIRLEIGDYGGLAWCLEKLAEIAIHNEGFEAAARLLGVAAALRQEASSPIHSADRPHVDGVLRSLHDHLGPETFQAAWEQGLALPVGEAVRLALSA